MCVCVCVFVCYMCSPCSSLPAGQMLPVLARSGLLDLWQHPRGCGRLHSPGGLHHTQVLCSIREFLHQMSDVSSDEEGRCFTSGSAGAHDLRQGFSNCGIRPPEGSIEWGSNDALFEFVILFVLLYCILWPFNISYSLFYSYILLFIYI